MIGGGRSGRGSRSCRCNGEILCTTFFARTGMKTRAFMRYSAHVSGGASRSERSSRGCAASADPGTTRAVSFHRRQLQKHTHATQEQLQSREREIEHLKLLLAKLHRMQFGRKSEKLERQIEQLELRLEELESNRSEQEPTRQHRLPSPPLRQLRQRNPRAAHCPIIFRDKRAGTSRKKRCVRNARASCAS